MMSISKVAQMERYTLIFALKAEHSGVEIAHFLKLFERLLSKFSKNLKLLTKILHQ